jgi:hypothetical protein
MQAAQSDPRELSSPVAPQTRDLRVFEYRPLGDCSDGIAVSVQGLRRLIAQRAVAPLAFECREVGQRQWLPMDHVFRLRTSSGSAAHAPRVVRAAAIRSARRTESVPSAGAILGWVLALLLGGWCLRSAVNSLPASLRDTASAGVPSRTVGWTAQQERSLPAESSAASLQPTGARAPSLSPQPERARTPGGSPRGSIAAASAPRPDVQPARADRSPAGTATPDTASPPQPDVREAAAPPVVPRPLAEALPIGPWTCGAAGDLSEDGASDVVVGGEAGMSFLRNDGAGRFTCHAVEAAAGRVKALALLDFDGDGDLDVLSTGSQTRLFANAGKAQLMDASDRLSLDAPAAASLALGDLDGDGDSDAMLATGTVLRNDGGRFVTVVARLSCPPYAQFAAVALGDIDGDGDLDAVLAQRGDRRGAEGRNWGLRNRGDGTFEDVSQEWMRSGPGATALALADLDGNGHADLITAHDERLGQPTRSVVHYFRHGRFHRTHADVGGKAFASALARARSVGAGDIDGDGDVDVVFGNVGSETVYCNDGTGVLEPAPALPSSQDDSRAVLVVDLDGDARAEIVTVNFKSALCSASLLPTARVADAPAPGADADAGARDPLLPMPARKYDLRRHARTYLTQPSERRARQAIDAALRFLAACQGSDGVFGVPVAGGEEAAGEVSATATTALSLLCFLAEGSHPRQGAHATIIEQGVSFLLQVQATDGRFGAAQEGCALLDHALATLVLAEALVLGGDQTLCEPLERAVDWLHARRGADGGFALLHGEPSQGAPTVWAALALLAAHDAGVGLSRVHAEATRGFLRGVVQQTGAGAGVAVDAEGCERLAGDGPYGLLLAEADDVLSAGALFVRLALGEHPHELRPLLERAASALPRRGRLEPLAWFLGAQALVQLGGAEWDEWREALHDALPAPAEGALAGTVPWRDAEGRLVATALTTLALQAEYRFRPLVDPRWRRARAGSR